MTQASNGDTVKIHYTGRLTDGTTFDSSEGRQPLEFEIGSGQIIPGLDREIAGMAVGESKTVEVPSAEAYGPHHPEGVQSISRNDIPENIELEVGLQLQATSAEGQPMRLTVVQLDDESVTVDANHPLAGKDLVFEVELVEIV